MLKFGMVGCYDFDINDNLFDNEAQKVLFKNEAILNILETKTVLLDYLIFHRISEAKHIHL